MNYNFYANKEDKIEILDFIFNSTDLKVYDLNSPYNKEIAEYKNTSEILSKFDLEIGTEFAWTFQLWSKRHKSKPTFRRIELNPKHCDGNTFRYATNGLGLIQLYFGGIEKDGLNQSHIGHFSEKGAEKNELNNITSDKTKDWDWSEIKSTSTKLKYYIHSKLAIDKKGSCGILKGANNLIKTGTELK